MEIIYLNSSLIILIHLIIDLEGFNTIIISILLMKIETY